MGRAHFLKCNSRKEESQSDFRKKDKISPLNVHCTIICILNILLFSFTSGMFSKSSKLTVFRGGGYQKREKGRKIEKEKKRKEEKKELKEKKGEKRTKEDMTKGKIEGIVQGKQ